MAIVRIDTDKWITPKEYAKLHGISPSAVTKRMKQKAYEGKVFLVPEIGVKLIESPEFKKSKK